MKMLKRILLAVTMIAPMLFVSCDWSELSASPYFHYLELNRAAGVLGDEAVIYMDSLHAAEWMASGALRPIPELIPSDLDTRLLPYFQRQGKTYAIPHNFQTIAMVVNRKLLNEVGEEAPRNWDELRQVAQKLRNTSTGRRGVALTPGVWNFLPFLYQAGGALYNPGTGEVAINSSAAIEAMKYYSELYQKDLIFPGVSAGFVGGSPYWGAHNELLDAFAKGQVAILFLGPGMYDDLLHRMKLSPSSPYPVEVYDLPAGPKGKATIGMVRGFAVMSGKPMSEATRLFLEYITRPEAMSFWIGDSSSFIPALKSSQTQWLRDHRFAAAFGYGIETMQPKAPYPISYAGAFEFETAAEPIMMDAMLGKLPPADAVKKLDETAKIIVERTRVR